MKKVEKSYNGETLKIKALKTLKVEHAIECSEMTAYNQVQSTRFLRNTGYV